MAGRACGFWHQVSTCGDYEVRMQDAEGAGDGTAEELTTGPYPAKLVQYKNGHSSQKLPGKSFELARTSQRQPLPVF